MKDKKADLIKGFSKIFVARLDDNKDDLLKMEDFKIYLHNSNCIGVIPKKKSIKDYLVINYDVTEKEFNKDTFDYKFNETDLKLDECVSTYSGEFLKMVLELSKNSERVKLKIKKDYPLWVETEDLILMIAPRVDTVID